MKKSILFIIPFFFFLGCDSTKDIANQESQKHPIIGKWTMTQHMSMAKFSEFEEGDVVWEFKDDYTLVKTFKDEDMNTKGSSTNNLTYTINGKMLIVQGTQKYFFRIGTANENLSLDSNTDPRLSNDLPTMAFKRID